MLETMFGPYRIEALLGRGGMGEVYRAHDTETDRTVALKLLPSHLAEDDEYQARFRRECKVAARLSEPHVVPIHRFGEIEGRLYLDMRLVEGSDLGAWLREHGPMAPDVAVAVIGQVAQALDAAHADGLVHRDVKPSNVLLAGITGREVDAASVFAYLFDFGIARARDGATSKDEVALTMAGVMPGSPSYVAPERFAGVEGDPRADVYALGCVLHQALTGRPPFEGDLASLMRAHLHTPPPRASTQRAGVPSGLDDVVGRGMAKDLDTRYSTAGELAAAARAVLSTGSGYNAPAPAPEQTVNIGDRTVRADPAPLATPRPAPRPVERRPAPTRPQTGIRQDRTAPPVPVNTPPVTPSYGSPSYGSPSYGSPSYGSPAYGSAAYDSASYDSPSYKSSSGSSTAGSSTAGSSTARMVWIAAVVVVVVAVASGLVLTNFGATSGSGQKPPTSTTAPAPPTEDGKLLAKLPGGFGTTNCASDGAMRDQVGALSYVSCNTGPATGPDSGSFARFSSMAPLEKEYARVVDEAGVAASPTASIEDCKTKSTVRGEWGRGTAPDVVTAGSIACFIEATDNSAYLIWTDRNTFGFGYVRRADGDAAKLYDWWRNADL